MTTGLLDKHEPVPIPTRSQAPPRTSLAAEPVAHPMHESKPVRIQIPSIEIDAQVTQLGLRPDRTMQVPPDGRVAGWYSESPTPGELGPSVIVAHVDWNGESGVFYHIDDLHPGAEVRIQRQDGTTAVFLVDETLRFSKSKFPTNEVYGNIGFAGLRLITCGGEFDSQARSYVDNIVVDARLVASKP